VRTYWRAPAVNILAWDKGENLIGLRGAVSLTGDLVGGAHRGDHTLYLTPLLAWSMGGYTRAAIMPAERILVSAGPRRDEYACYYGRPCSPIITRTVSIPDSILRANRDSLVVTFFPYASEPWTITLRHELIEAYLDKVDSIATAMRGAASR
jgi:hypothetical protein